MISNRKISWNIDLKTKVSSLIFCGLSLQPGTAHQVLADDEDVRISQFFDILPVCNFTSGWKSSKDTDSNLKTKEDDVIEMDYLRKKYETELQEIRYFSVNHEFFTVWRLKTDQY